jgi:hypothetical protein
LYLVWVASQGLGTANICAGIGLLLFIVYMVDLKRSETRADRNIARRIRAEYPVADQPHVYELYERLKARELEYLFQKVLDEAGGNLDEARKLTGLAENIGWKAFLENRW